MAEARYVGSTVVVNGNTAQIITRRGKAFLIDKKDAETCDKYMWYVNSDGYAHTTIGGKKTKLHRFLLRESLNAQLEVDHINGNITDNRRANLRVCTHAENGKNMKKLKSELGITGVRRSGKKYQAQIRREGKQTYLGTFDTVEEAIAARIAAERLLYGQFSPKFCRKRGPCAANSPEPGGEGAE
jgi:hypothetical protein